MKQSRRSAHEQRQPVEHSLERPDSSACGRDAATLPSIQPSAWARWTWSIVVIAIVGIPLVIWPGAGDTFRLPKDLLVRALAIVLVACALIGTIYGGFRPTWRVRDPIAGICVAIVVWTSIVTLTSTNKPLAILALGWVAANAVLFLAAYWSVDDQVEAAVATLVAPAIVNAVLVLLQLTHVWQPFKFMVEIEPAAKLTGLVGNPRDLGAYLIAPAILAAAHALAVRKWRPAFIVVTILLSVALVATRGLTVTAAYCVALGAMALLHTRRSRLPLLLALCGVVAVVGLYKPLRDRAFAAATHLHGRDINDAMIDRATAYRAAWRMGIDHPLFGVGPGCYGWQYYDYKLGVEHRHPELLQSSTRYLNFGEAHNDYLQTLAVAGVPGLVLLFASLASLALISLRRHDQDGGNSERERLSRLIGLPLAVAIGVVATAFFPFELPASMATYAITAGICCAWRQR